MKDFNRGAGQSEGDYQTHFAFRPTEAPNNHQRRESDTVIKLVIAEAYIETKLLETVNWQKCKHQNGNQSAEKTYSFGDWV
ncbi:hypothetical protein NKH33_30915 [Mesorhizobium sp. M1182]|uniref:hypothetical protein n=1 Tax=Mesorhizobium sp. M1182 TaxID=2957067 RepID=UPI00333CEAF5